MALSDDWPDEEPCGCSELVKPGEYYHCPVCDAEWHPEDDDDHPEDTP